MPNATYAEPFSKEAANRGAAASEMAARIRPGTRVPEIGCGAGVLTVAMARRGALTLGVDVAERAIATARDYYQAHRGHLAGIATYETADVNGLKLAERQYDAVVAKGIMHHLPRADSPVERLHPALEQDGLLFVGDMRGDETSTGVTVSARKRVRRP